MTTRYILAALVAAGALAAATTAEARIYKHVVRDAFLLPLKSGEYMPLDNSGTTSLSFVVPKAGPVAITYSADCNMQSGYDAKITILVDDVVVAPTQDAQFCSYAASYVSASRTVVTPLARGRHTVKIRFWNYDPTTEVNIGNGTLLVFD